MKTLQIGVLGSAGPEEYPYQKPDKAMYATAGELGKNLAAAGCIVVCGGKGGIMTAVAKGAKETGGTTVAETSGSDRSTSNGFIDVEVVTGDVAFRGPSQLVGMSDAVIALGGGAGTLQELCVAYRMRKPIVLLTGYGGWTDRLAGQQWLDERRLVPFNLATDAAGAVDLAVSLVQSKRRKT